MDSRLVQSIKFLFTKPGFLTREYVSGRRVSYLPPLRLYLVASVIFFLSITVKTMIPELRTNRLIQEFSESGSIDSALAKVEHKLPAASERRNQGLVEEDSLSGPMSLTVGSRQFGVEQGDFLAQFRDRFAKMMFLLLPVAAFWLKLFYWRRQKLYVEHLIFSLHVHAFIFSLLILTVLFDFKIVTWAVILASLIYLYLAMKAYYAQPHGKTALKMLLLLLGYGFSLLLVMSLTLLITAFDLVLGLGAG